MNTRAYLCMMLGLGLAVTGVVAADELDFEPTPGFVKLPDTIRLGACSAAAVNSKGEVYLLHRGEQPIIVLDPQVNFVRSWGEHAIDVGHGLRIVGTTTSGSRISKTTRS